MPSRAPFVVLVASAALFVGAGVAWQRASSQPPRSDLAGVAVSTVARAGTGAGKTSRLNEPISPPEIFIPDTTASASPTTPVDAPVGVEARPGVPERIVIPSLNVDAPVVSVGMNPDRSMEIPGAFEAGWYDRGPLPGDERGSAVIAGHVDHRESPGVFIELRRLEIGEQVSVHDANGVQHGYTVTERFQVDKEQLPSRELFRRSGPPVLTLITCGGAFDRKLRSYDDNIVIRAVPLFTGAAEPNSVATDARRARLLAQTR